MRNLHRGISLHYFPRHQSRFCLTQEVNRIKIHGRLPLAVLELQELPQTIQLKKGVIGLSRYLCRNRYNACEVERISSETEGRRTGSTDDSSTLSLQRAVPDLSAPG